MCDCVRNTPLFTRDELVLPHGTPTCHECGQVLSPDPTELDEDLVARDTWRPIGFDGTQYRLAL